MFTATTTAFLVVSSIVNLSIGLWAIGYLGRDSQEGTDLSDSPISFVDRLLLLLPWRRQLSTVDASDSASADDQPAEAEADPSEPSEPSPPQTGDSDESALAEISVDLGQFQQEMSTLRQGHATQSSDG